MNLKQKVIGLLQHSDDVRTAFVENGDNLASSRRNLFAGAIFGGMFSNLSGGVFLTSLILYMMEGSDTARQNDFLGIFSMLGLAVGMVQFLSPMIMEHFPRRKKLLLVLRSIYHVMNIVMLGLVPILPVSLNTKLWLFLAIYVLSSLIVQLSSAAFSVWHIADLPGRTRTSYFALVNMCSPIVSSLLATGASLFLDKATAGGWQFGGLLLLRAFALIFAALEIFAFSRIVELEYPKPEKKLNPVSMLTLPFRTPAYLVIVLMTAIYSFGGNLAGQYFQAYLLEDVGLPYTLISGMAIFSIPIYLFIYPVWSRLINRFDWHRVLFAAVVLYTSPYLLNAYTTLNHWWFFIPSCLTAYFFAPGITLTFANLPYTNIPKTNQTSYIAFYSTINNLFGFLGSTASRALVNAIGTEPITFLGTVFPVRAFINLFPCITLVLTGVIALLIYSSDRKKSAKAE